MKELTNITGSMNYYKDYTLKKLYEKHHQEKEKYARFLLWKESKNYSVYTLKTLYKKHCQEKGNDKAQALERARKNIAKKKKLYKDCDICGEITFDGVCDFC